MSVETFIEECLNQNYSFHCSKIGSDVRVSVLRFTEDLKIEKVTAIGVATVELDAAGTATAQITALDSAVKTVQFKMKMNAWTPRKQYT